MNITLPQGYSLRPTGLFVDSFAALNLRLNGKDCGVGFLQPPSQADVDRAIAGRVLIIVEDKT